MKSPQFWSDYKLIDAGEGERLEQWGSYIVRRPDIHSLGEKKNIAGWNNPDAHFSEVGKGWIVNRVPEKWEVKYKDLHFWIKLMSNKQVGLFPEQAINWDWIIKKSEKLKIKNQKCGDKPKLLNLFGYTGGGTVASLKAGFDVTHVDSNKAAINLTLENIKLNNLDQKDVRMIHEDVLKFVTKEYKRGNKYDAIIMDPPAFGRGTKKEVWSIKKDLDNLLELLHSILSNNPKFFILSSYTDSIGLNIIESKVEKFFGSIFPKKDKEELGLQTIEGKYLNCGITLRLY